MTVDPRDRSAVVAGGVVLVAITAAYLVLPARTLPLGVFVVPGLYAAVLGGPWATLIIGGLSLAVGVLVSVAVSPLAGDGAGRLMIRWAVIAATVLLAAWGARTRRRQAHRIMDLGRTVGVHAAFIRNLAPSPSPPAGLTAISRYRPAEARIELGGDFLDAITLPGGRLAVLIGDVCGHGPAEAATGAALRAGWKGIVLGHDVKDPGEWIAALDRAFLQDGRVDGFATLCTGYFDLSANRAVLVNAGHPGPLILGPRTERLPLTVCPPLGVNPGGWSVTEFTWSGEPILFYTDGLVENPRTAGPAHRWGEESLITWLDHHRDPDPGPDLLDELLTAATLGRDIRDDIALLLIRQTRTTNCTPHRNSDPLP